MDHTGLSPNERDLVVVSPDTIDGAALVDAVRRDDAGAVVLFLGTVRDHSPGRARVTGLEYEAYAGVVETMIAGIVAEARERWDLGTVAAAHRVGALAVGEVSVGVAVSAGHRPEAFDAARYLIDELKARAPIWKKERWAGGAEWVGS
jgi:molybdopterin synthase catalytic subunit